MAMVGFADPVFAWREIDSVRREIVVIDRHLALHCIQPSYVLLTPCAGLAIGTMPQTASMLGAVAVTGHCNQLLARGVPYRVHDSDGLVCTRRRSNLARLRLWSRDSSLCLLLMLSLFSATLAVTLQDRPDHVHARRHLTAESKYGSQSLKADVLAPADGTTSLLQVSEVRVSSLVSRDCWCCHTSQPGRL